MAQRSRKPFKLGLDPAAYNPYGLRAYNEQELRGEYVRLRREASERLRKLGASEFAQDKVYTENKDKFIPVKDVQDVTQLRYLIVDAARFVTAKGSSASGQRAIRREQIKSLHDTGYKFVNTQNFRDFLDFLDWLKDKNDDDSNWYSQLKLGAAAGKTPPLSRREKKRIKDLWEEWKRHNGDPEAAEEDDEE